MIMNYSIETNDKQKALKIIADTYEINGQNYDCDIFPPHLPMNDSATLKLFQEGRTIGILAFEMAKMQHLLRDLHPQDFDQIATLAMYYYSERRENLSQLISETTMCRNVDPLTLEYAYLAYQMAYLKAHHTEAFMVATVKNHIGNDVWLSVYMNECKRLGVRIYGL